VQKKDVAPNQVDEGGESNEEMRLKAQEWLNMPGRK
jgi:hypothetical protein